MNVSFVRKNVQICRFQMTPFPCSSGNFLYLLWEAGQAPEELSHYPHDCVLLEILTFRFVHRKPPTISQLQFKFSYSQALVPLAISIAESLLQWALTLCIPVSSVLGQQFLLVSSFTDSRRVVFQSGQFFTCCYDRVMTSFYDFVYLIFWWY